MASLWIPLFLITPRPSESLNFLCDCIPIFLPHRIISLHRIVMHTCFKTANGFFMLQGERYTYASAVLKPGSNELNLNYLHAIFPLILELSNRMVTTNFSLLSEQLLCFSQLFWAGFLLELLQFQSFYLPWQKYWVHTELIICFLCSKALTLY